MRVRARAGPVQVGTYGGADGHKRLIHSLLEGDRVQAHVDVDPVAIERHLLALAACGACEATGVWQPAYSPAWSAAREQLTAMYRSAGLDIPAVG